MKELSREKMWIVYLTTYPPRKCGMATFSADLVESFDQLFVPREETKVIALNTDVLQTYNYPHKVIFQISENKPADYIATAQKLNKMPYVKLISIQHEFGIFGGNYGDNLLVFLQEIRKPIVITFHTILPNPPEEMKRVVCKMIERAERLIVMTNISKELLETVYGAPTEKVKVIPHGIHPLPYTDGKEAKATLRLTNKRVLSTFGLLNRRKGIEHAIAALPKIVEAYPNAVYLVIGVTHPVVLKHEGEVYRNQLIEETYRLGMQNHVLFYDKYLETDELLKFLQATDIYLSLSQNPDQAVSGTLTYAIGAGRPVISTPFMQAKEMITPEVGALVDFGDSEGISRKILSLFGNQEQLVNMSKNAYFRTRGMTWPNVALSYMREFIELSPELAKKEKNMPPIKLQHLNKLTDDFGIFQFAVLAEPDSTWGYTLDDNARALVVTSWYHQMYGGQIPQRLAKVYINFLEHSSKARGGFENYFTGDKHVHHSRNTGENLEDANARAMWSLAVAAASELPVNIKERAKALFKKQCDMHKDITSPRAAAFCIKALTAWLARGADGKASGLLTKYADFLLNLFNQNTSDDWQWLEETMTYSNAVLPEALLLAYKITGNYDYYKAGKAALDFLVRQSFQGELCVPVGQAGWLKRGGAKQLYDQQPEEVSALVLALHTMFNLSGDRFYIKKMEGAFSWFLGNNILNLVVYSHMTGGCYDGLGERQINLNQGAESTISYLLARLVIESKPL